MAERKLNGIWNATSLLQALLCFADDRGHVRNLDLSNDSPYSIKVRRFVATIKAYGKEDCLYFGNEHLVSNTCSEEKLEELCQLLRENLRDKYPTALANPDYLKGVRERCVLFETLFHYRKSLYKVENMWSGVMECSSIIALGIKVTNNIYQTHIKPTNDVIDRIMVLLLGDDYDRSFTEYELLAYGYPDVTDEELQDMILDNW